MYYRRRWAQTFDQTAKMSQRLDNTKWLWCLLALHAGSLWGTTRSATKTPQNNPSTIETQAKFFQDFFSVQLSPYKIEFGHVCEDPNTWEQRYEKKDFKNHRDMGKVRWGDKKGGYGEHYWDLNHAGNADNHGNDNYEGDNGSYHELSDNDPYDEPSDNVSTYNNDEYDPEKASYEESGRAKRAYPKIKVERKHKTSAERDSEDESRSQKKQKRRNREQIKEAETSQEEEDIDDDVDDNDDESYEKPKSRRQKQRKQEETPKTKEKKQFVLVVSHKDDDEKQQNQDAPELQTENAQYLPEKQREQPRYLQQQPELPQYLPQAQPEFSQYSPQVQNEKTRYFPYEGGAGVRQHHQQDAAATNVPRLFLEASTGHVVDRATGQAYVLQPIGAHNNYN